MDRPRVAPLLAINSTQRTRGKSMCCKACIACKRRLTKHPLTCKLPPPPDETTCIQTREEEGEKQQHCFSIYFRTRNIFGNDVRRVERACGVAAVQISLSLSLSLCSGWADFSCPSRSLEKEEGDRGRGRAGGSCLSLLPPSFLPPSVVHSHSLRLSNALELLRSSNVVHAMR